MSLLSYSFCLDRWYVADLIAELLGAAFCVAGRRLFEIIAVVGRMLGCDWETDAPHALFSSNPVLFSSGFCPRGLKRLEVL
jgi:hypothetical protein